MALGGTLTRTLQVVIGADSSRLQTALGGATRSADTMANKLRRGIGTATPYAAAGLAALGGVAVKSVNAFSDFQESMSKITGLVGIARGEVDEMSKGVLNLSRETGKNATELADGMFVITSAGLRGEDAMSALAAAGKASAAGLGEVSDIGRAVAGSMNAYGAGVLNAAEATDIITATARAGNFETSQFSAALGRVLPFAKQAGAGLDEVGGAVALLTRTNGDAAQSVTQMSALFRAFVVPTAEAKKVLGEVGLSAGDVRDKIKKQGLVAALRDLDKQLGGNREKLGKLLGSSEAASAAFQILDADTAALDDTFGTVANAAGITDEAFSATADTARFKMDKAVANTQAALISFGGAVAPVFETFAGLLSKVAGFLAEHTTLVKVVALAFAGLATAVLAVSAALKVMAAFAALASPIGAVAVAVAAVTAGVILLWKRSGTFRQIVTGAWEAVQKIVETVVGIFDGPVKAAFDVIVNAAKALGKLLTGDFSGAWEAAKGVVRGVLDWIKETILALPATILTAAVGIGSAIVNGIKNGVATLGETVWDAIKGLPGNLLTRVGAWLTGLAKIGSTVIGYIKSGATGLANAVWANITNMPAALINKVGAWLTGLAEIGGKVIGYIKSGVTGLASAVWSNISGFPSALWNKITGSGGWADTIKGWGSSIGGWIKDNFVNALKGIGGALKSAVLAPVRALSKWIVDKWPNVPGLPGPPQWLKNLSTAGLGNNGPAMALGGIVDRPMRAIIGEAGPEAVVPLSNPTGRRALADALREAGAGAAAPQAGPTVVLNVHGVMAADVREFAARLKPELDRVLVAGY